MKKILFSLALVLVLLPVIVNATTYYVDATGGSDSYNGQYPTFQGGSDGPWQTWDKVRGETYSAGDTINFKRGETWYPGNNERWEITEDGTSENYITIQDYGLGTKPIFDCTAEFNGKTWTDEGGNVWSTSFTVTVYRVRLDGVDSGEAANSGAIDGSTYLWSYDGVADKLYVYATQNPNSEYTNITVYHANRFIFRLNGCNYIKFKNLRLYGGQYSVLFGTTSTESYIEFDNVDMWYGYYGIRAEKTAGGGGSANYVTLTNCNIDSKINYIDKAIASTEECIYDGIQAHNECNNWTIQNCYFGAWGHTQIGVGNPHAGASQGVHNWLVEHNEFNGIDGNYCKAITINGYDGKTTNNIFRYNIFHDTYCRIQFGGDSNEFYYNIVYNTHDTPLTNKADISQGILVSCIKEGMSSDGNKVYNNVFYNNYNEHIYIGNDAVNSIIKNNIFMEVDGGGWYADACLVWHSMSGTGHTVSNNCFYTSGGTDVIYVNKEAPTGYQTVAEADAGHSGFSNNVGSDPKFVNPGSADFHLQSDSLCIDNGIDVGLSLDFDGTSVPQGSAPDIGAFEFESVGETPVCEPNTYYVDASNGDDGNDGMCTTTAWQTIAKVNGETFFPGDNILFKRGEIWRERLIVPSSGSSGNPITFGKYGSGDNPVIKGSNLVNGWTVYSGNLWKATCSTDPRKMIFFDGTKGDRKSGIGSLTNEYDWFWSDGTLYVYSTSNPDTAYTNPGIEAPKRDRCTYCSKSYIVIDGIDHKHARYDSLYFTSTSASPTVKNLTVHGSGGSGIILLYTSNITIYNVTATYNFNSGIRPKGCTGGTISYCDCGYNNVESDSGWGHGIDPAESTYLTIEHNKCHHSGTGSGIGGDKTALLTIQHNEIYNNYYHGIDISSEEIHSSYNVIRYNLIYNNTGALACCGILLYTHDIESYLTAYNEVYYNILYGNTLGIRLMGHAENNEIYNNVFYENGGGVSSNPEISIINQGSAWPKNNTIKNNIFYRTNGRFVECRTSTENNTFDYNCYYPESNNCFKWVSTYRSTLSAWQSASGQDINSSNYNPLFIDASNNDFILQAGSPCIDKGIDVGLTLDYEGNSVPQGAGVDIGAYEFESGAGCGVVPGDLDVDCDVDIFDLILITSHFGQTQSHPNWSATSDVIVDGEIDIYDLVFVASRFT